jgi:hypothetical protein
MERWIFIIRKLFSLLLTHREPNRLSAVKSNPISFLCKVKVFPLLRAISCPGKSSMLRREQPDMNTRITMSFEVKRLSNLEF